MVDDLLSTLKVLEDVTVESSLEPLPFVEPVMLIIGYGELGVNVVRILNDSDSYNFRLYLIKAFFFEDFIRILKTSSLSAKLSFLIFRLDSLNLLSDAEKIVKYLSDISENVAVIISIPLKITNKVDIGEIIKMLERIRAYSSVFLLEETAIDNDYCCFDPRYAVEDRIAECLDSLVHSTAIVPSSSYFYTLKKFFSRKRIGSLNYFTVDIRWELDEESVFKKFMRIPLRNIRLYDIEEALFLISLCSDQISSETFFDALLITRKILDKISLTSSYLGDLSNKNMGDSMGVAYFILLKNESNFSEKIREC